MKDFIGENNKKPAFKRASVPRGEADPTTKGF
jgi:hypothetical protein